MIKKKSNQERILFEKALENGNAIIFTPERLSPTRLKDRLYKFRTRCRKEEEDGNKYDDIVIALTPDKLSVKLTVERLEGKLVELAAEDNEKYKEAEGVLLSELITPMAEEKKDQENLIEAMKKKTVNTETNGNSDKLSKLIL